MVWCVVSMLKSQSDPCIVQLAVMSDVVGTISAANRSFLLDLH